MTRSAARKEKIEREPVNGDYFGVSPKGVSVESVEKFGRFVGQVLLKEGFGDKPQENPSKKRMKDAGNKRDCKECSYSPAAHFQSRLCRLDIITLCTPRV